LGSAADSNSIALAEGPERLVEPATSVSFLTEPTYTNIAFRCVAVGVRRKVIFNVYGVAFCLERSRAQQALDQAAASVGGTHTATELESTPGFFDALRDAPVAKAAHLIFVRAVSKEQATDALVQAVSGALGPEGADRVERLRGMVSRDVKVGEELILTTQPDGTVHVVLGQEDRSLNDPLVARLIWNVWLSPGGVSPTLRTSLARSAVH
jgi:hypothetical protein